ncbi:MAG TPA: efflux transporter outer membrane subunit, partial [Anaeromyxobacteraceae bacterium]|nr:efflux transporter outer membrane subunit [Anaeromyxobacteraceae bacterium]
GHLLTVTEKGYGKRSEASEYRFQGRGGSGVINIKVTDKNGPVAGIKSVTDADQLLLITERGQLIRIKVNGIRETGRAAQGVRLIDLDEGDRVVAVAKLAEPEEGDDEAQAALPAAPEAPVAQAFPAQGAAAPGARAAEDLGWRDVFGDARLQALVALALEQNRDLRVSALNVELTRAQFRIQRAQQLPHFDGSATLSAQRTPADLSTTRTISTTTAWSVGLGVSAFELDLWGRVRNLSDAALETFFASEEARRSAHLSLVASVAEQYLSLRSLEEQVVLARQTLETVEASLKVTRRTTEAGRTSELDLRTAESQVETARFNLAAAEEQRVRAQNALVLLVGAPLPVDLPPGLALDAQPMVAELPAGVPSEVLVRRPDVLSAEHALRAANASVGAARAAFFPTISLTAFGGSASSDLSGLVSGSPWTWTFSPRLTMPIFHAGELRASLDVAEVRKSIEVAQYERAIQAAFREVADALASRESLDAQLRAEAARVAAEERRYHLSDLRYRTGIDSYLTLLTAQRDLFAAQQGLIQTRLARLVNLVELYKALGGGWRERTETAGAAG